MEASRPSVLDRIAQFGRLVLLVLVAGWVASFGAVVWWEHHDQAQPAGAIVVLGAAQYAGRPSPVLKARLEHAIDLWQQHLAPVMIMTGGTGAGDTTSEAAVSRRYAVQRGVPASAILEEHEGRTTSESIGAVAALMAPRGRRDVLLVSDPFHMLRLSIVARRHGLEPLASPTPTSRIAASASEHWKYVFSESVKAPLTFIFERSTR